MTCNTNIVLWSPDSHQSHLLVGKHGLVGICTVQTSHHFQKFRFEVEESLLVYEDLG